jgi:ABC-type nitrate/sulfonate/bicarbonate transport system permease component
MTKPGPTRSWLADWLTLRKTGPLWESFLLGAFCIALCFGVWWVLTAGDNENRLVSPLALPSPAETFARAPELFKDPINIVANTLVTLRRLALGFSLALIIGIPLGILAGCFPRIGAFLSPLIIFGRNIPLAAILGLLYFIATGESRKVLFIFVACVAFIIADTAQAIADVATRYIDTAYTLGASRWQTIIKVLVPLALPAVFSSCRVMFGLAFGYIMLAENMRESDAVGGLGFEILTFQRRGSREFIYLIILLIPLVALVIDLILFWIQRQLFPHIYGGPGYLQRLARVFLHAWDDTKRVFFHYEPPALATAVPPPAQGVAAVPTAAPPNDSPPKGTAP